MSRLGPLEDTAEESVGDLSELGSARSGPEYGEGLPMTWEEVDEAALTIDEDREIMEAQIHAVDIEKRRMQNTLGEQRVQIDPLGIVQLDFSLTTKKEATFRPRLSSRSYNMTGKLRRYKINPLDENFDPVTFLIEAHGNTNGDDLKRGMVYLREQIEARQVQMQKLLETHFEQFVTCRDSLERISYLINAEVSADLGASKTLQVKSGLNQVHEVAQKVYGPLLERKDEVDRMARTLATLRRFNFLFAIPQAMQRHMDALQYDKVARDYQRVKRLAKSTSPLVQQIMDSIQKCVDLCRKRLIAKLKDPDHSVGEHEIFIAHLYALDCPRDPVWMYFDFRHAWAAKALKTEAEIAEKQSKSMGLFGIDFKSRSVPRRRKGKRGTSPGSQSESSNAFGSVNSVSQLQQRYTGSPSKAASTKEGTLVFVQSCSTILSHGILAFWKVATACLDGKYGATLANDDSKQRLQDMFRKFIQAVVGYLDDMVFVFPKEDSRPSSSAVQELCLLSQVCTTLNQHDVPYYLVSTLHHYVEKNTQAVLRRMLNGLLLDISALSLNEKWERNPHNVLCGSFSKMLQDTLDPLKPLISVSPTSSHWTPNVLARYFIEAMGCFGDVLHTLAFESTSKRQHLSNESILKLILQSQHIKNVFLPRFWVDFLTVVEEERHDAIEEQIEFLFDTFTLLDQILMDEYIHRCMCEIQAHVIDGLLMSGFTWDTHFVLQAPRQYVYLIQQSFVATLASCFRVDAHQELLESIVMSLFEKTCLCLASHMHEFDRLPAEAAHQLLLEIDFLRQSVGPQFQSATARRTLQQTAEELQGILTPDQRRLEENVLDRALQGNELVSQCFAVQ